MLEDMILDEWDDDTQIDCGDWGLRWLTIATVDGDSDLTEGTELHRNNHHLIMERWAALWPIARKQIVSMLVDYGRSPDLGGTDWYLQMTIPPSPIADGVEWSIALRFDEFDGVWDVAFHGWELSEGYSQPYF